jgi:hypothetical protein
MAFFTKSPRYRTYLLTIWEERRRDPAYPTVWCFRLEDPHTGEQRGFGNFEELMAFLRGALDSAETYPSGG